MVDVDLVFNSLKGYIVGFRYGFKFLGKWSIINSGDIIVVYLVFVWICVRGSLSFRYCVGLRGFLGIREGF